MHDGPHLDQVSPWPALGHGERLIEVLDLDDREAPEDFLGLDERAVGDGCLAVLVTHGGRGARALELLAAHDLAGLAVLLEPLPDAGVGGLHLLGRHLLPLLLLVRRARKHEDVLHPKPPSRAVIGAASSTRRTAAVFIDTPRTRGTPAPACSGRP